MKNQESKHKLVLRRGLVFVPFYHGRSLIPTKSYPKSETKISSENRFKVDDHSKSWLNPVKTSHEMPEIFPSVQVQVKVDVEHS